MLSTGRRNKFGAADYAACRYVRPYFHMRKACSCSLVNCVRFFYIVDSMALACSIPRLVEPERHPGCPANQIVSEIIFCSHRVLKLAARVNL